MMELHALPPAEYRYNCRQQTSVPVAVSIAKMYYRFVEAQIPEEINANSTLFFTKGCIFPLPRAGVGSGGGC